MNITSLIERIDRGLELALYYLSAILIIALTAVILYAVVARYFFNNAPSWSEEVPRVIFLWASYLAVAVAVRRGKSLRVTLFIDQLARGPRLALELVMHTAIITMLAFLVWFNIPVIELSSHTKMLATGWSEAIRYWPLTVGCLLMMLYQCRLALRDVAAYRAGA